MFQRAARARRYLLTGLVGLGGALAIAGCGSRRDPAAMSPEDAVTGAVAPAGPSLAELPVARRVDLPERLPVGVDGTQLPDPAPFVRLNPTSDPERAWLLAEGPARVAGEGRRLVTLTFDDGPGPRTTDALLKVLRQHHVLGTFFMVPSYFEGPSKRAAKIRRAAANVVAAGHLVGNHTMHHRRLRGLSLAQTRAEIDNASQLIEQVTGRRPHLFRPPFGAVDDLAVRVLRDDQLELAMWTIEAHDMLREDAPAMTQDLIRQLDYAQGGVVLLHDVKWSTVKVVDSLLRYLESAKYDPEHPERPGYEIVDYATYMRLTGESPQPYATRAELNRAREQGTVASPLHAKGDEGGGPLAPAPRHTRLEPASIRH